MHNVAFIVNKTSNLSIRGYKNFLMRKEPKNLGRKSMVGLEVKSGNTYILIGQTFQYIYTDW